MRLGDTPVPIPNTMVKTWPADGTMPGTAWESRWLPGPFSFGKGAAGVRPERKRCGGKPHGMYLENCIPKIERHQISKVKRRFNFIVSL